MALPPTHSPYNPHPPPHTSHTLPPTLPLVQTAHHLASYQSIISVLFIPYLPTSIPLYIPTCPAPFSNISQLYSSLITVHIIYLERHIVLLAPRAPDHMSTYPLSSACQYPTGPPHTRQGTLEPGILVSPRAGSAILT